MNGLTTAARNASRRSSVTCGMPRAWQRSRATPTAAGEQQARSACRALRIDPEAKRHAHRFEAGLLGLEQRDGAVHPAAHRDGDAALAGSCACSRPDRGGKCVGGETGRRHRGRREQGQALNRLRRAGARRDPPRGPRRSGRPPTRRGGSRPSPPRRRRLRRAPPRHHARPFSKPRGRRCTGPKQPAWSRRATRVRPGHRCDANPFTPVRVSSAPRATGLGRAHEGVHRRPLRWPRSDAETSCSDIARSRGTSASAWARVHSASARRASTRWRCSGSSRAS